MAGQLSCRRNRVVSTFDRTCMEGAHGHLMLLSQCRLAEAGHVSAVRVIGSQWAASKFTK